MRILGLPADDSGACQYYRVEQPLKAMQQVGLCQMHIPPMRHLPGGVTERPVRIHALTAEDKRRIRAFYGVLQTQEAEQYIRQHEALPDASQYDLLLFQRQPMNGVEELTRAVQANGVKVVYDMDDDLFSVPKSNHAYRMWGTDPQAVLDWWGRMKLPLPPGMEPTAKSAREFTRKMREGILRNMAAADLVTVTTSRLAEVYAPYAKSLKVLPNQMVEEDWAYIQPLRHDNELWFGWAGSKTHLGDLKLVEHAIGQVLRVVPEARFVVIGFPEVLTYMQTVPKERCYVFEHKPMSEYRELLASLDVVWAPSEDIPFNLAKSDIRVLEAWMCLRPVVASATTYGATVREAGGGYVAYNPKVWVEATVDLLRSTDFRNRLALAGTAYTLSKRTYRQCAEDWHTTYSRLLQDNKQSRWHNDCSGDFN